jgi:hypothetical protein
MMIRIWHTSPAALAAFLRQLRCIALVEIGLLAKIFAFGLLDLPDLPAGEVLVEFLGPVEHLSHIRHAARVPSTNGLIEDLVRLQRSEGRAVVWSAQ